MNHSLPSVLERMISKLELRAPLVDGDREALLALPYRLQTIEPGKYIVREGSSATHSALIVSGFACRHKVTIDGARQIISVHIPGDFIDLEGAMLNFADHNVQALSRCELALVPVEAVRKLAAEHPMIAQAASLRTASTGTSASSQRESACTL